MMIQPRKELTAPVADANIMTVWCVAVPFAILSAVTGIVADFTRIKSVQPSGGTCSYPGSPAYGLGITSVVCLTLAQITITAASALKCREPHGSRPPRKNALFCFVYSWIVFLVASVGLLAAAYLNGKIVDTLDDGKDDCFVLWPGGFTFVTISAQVGIFHGLMTHMALCISTANLDDDLPTTQADVDTMQQPLLPPPLNANAPPVNDDEYLLVDVVCQNVN